MRHWKIVIAITLCLPTMASMASEEQEAARTACMKVMLLINKVNDSNTINAETICQYNVKSKRYWACTEDRMRTGESFAYAANQCELSKKHSTSKFDHSFYDK